MARQISLGLERNRSLQRFSIVSSDGFEEGAADIYVSGLLSNYTVIEAYSHKLSPEQRQLIQHFCDLNRFGRKHLRDPNATPMEVWPWVLAKANDPVYGLNVLFYVVRNRPEIYDVRSRLFLVGG
jgi:hypothetical protein